MLVEVNALNQQDFIDILKQANQRIIDSGQKMWNLEDLTIEGLQKEYDGGTYYIGYINDQPAYTAILMLKDVPFWGESSHLEKAVYLHKLSVSNAFKGTGASFKMLDDIKEKAKSMGLNKMRLDVRKNKPKLIAFYERYGFKLVEENDYYYGRGCLYELKFR